MPNRCPLSFVSLAAIAIIFIIPFALTLTGTPALAADAPIISPDVPLSFTAAGATGGGQHVVLTTPKWTILADFHDDLITDAEGAHIRKLFRRPTGGGEAVEIWSGWKPGDPKPPSDQPRVWAAYDDGAVLFTLGTDLLFVPKPGECYRRTFRVNNETWLPVYGDREGLVLLPLDGARAREAYYVPGQRDAFDLEQRVKITGDAGIRWAEPLVKRYGDTLAWLDWPSWDQVPCTHYRLAAFNLQAKTGWSRELDVPAGNAQFEHLNAQLAQVSGKRYDVATGEPK